MPSWVVSDDVLAPAIRRATAADLPRIVELLQQLMLDATAREDLGPPLPQRYYDAFAAIEASSGSSVLVAEYSGNIAGTFHFNVIPTLRRGGVRIAQIEAVVVEASMRGHGIGEAMMRWALDEARRQGCRQVELTSHKDRADAHRFYERLGFTKSHEGFKLRL